MDDMPLRVGGRDIAGALDLIRRYCGLAWSGGPPETWAYHCYDRVPTALDNDVTPVDVLTAASLHPGLSREDLAFFRDAHGALSEWLSATPNDTALADADDDRLRQLATLADFGEDVSLTLLTKVLHRKRPQLIPLLDRHVIDWYRPVTGERSAPRAWEPILRAMRGDMTGEPRMILAIASGVLRGEMTEPTPSWTRMIDIAIWMAARR